MRRIPVWTMRLLRIGDTKSIPMLMKARRVSRSRLLIKIPCFWAPRTESRQCLMLPLVQPPRFRERVCAL